MAHDGPMQIEERHVLLVEIGVVVNDGAMVSDVMVIPAGCVLPLLSKALPRVVADALRAELAP